MDRNRSREAGPSRGEAPPRTRPTAGQRLLLTEALWATGATCPAMRRYYLEAYRKRPPLTCYCAGTNARRRDRTKSARQFHAMTSRGCGTEPPVLTEICAVPDFSAFRTDRGSQHLMAYTRVVGSGRNSKHWQQPRYRRCPAAAWATGTPRFFQRCPRLPAPITDRSRATRPHCP